MESRESIDIEIKRYLLMFKRRWKIAVAIIATTVSISVVATTFLKPSYQASGKLLFRNPSFQVLEGEDQGELTSLSRQNPINNQLELIWSPAFLQEVIDKLNLKNKNGDSLDIESIGNGLSLKIIGGTDVVRVSYTSGNPEEAVKIVNTIMDLYLQNDISINNSEAEATRKFLTKDLPQKQAAVDMAGLKLSRFKQQNNIIDISEEIKLSAAIVGSLDQEISSIKAQLEDLSGQIEALRQKIGLNSQEVTIVSRLSQSPTLQEILKNLQAIDLQLGIERSRFSDNNPLIINLLAKKANLNRILETEVEKNLGNQTKIPPKLLEIGVLRQNLIQFFLQLEIQRIGLAKRLTLLSNTRLVYEKRLQLIPQLTQEQRTLERNLEVAESTYRTVLQKIQQLQVAEKKNTANGKIIAKALMPEKPVSGTKRLFVIVGLLSGLFFAAIVVLLLELRDKSFKTLEEIAHNYQYNLLGTLPLLAKKRSSRHPKGELTDLKIVLKDAPHSLTSEMYGMIQANLRFLSSDKELKTIVVTSALSQEGKSTVSANLAVAIAQLGHRVLLVDANMRFPDQHHLWELNNEPGLSKVLAGQSDLKYTPHPVMDNLDVLTSGSRPQNPLALLDSEQMALLIEDFCHEYDFVIFDAPSLLIAADALTLSQMTDGIVLVARPGIIDAKSVMAAKDMLDRSSQNVLGLLVNGLLTDAHS
ncbi:GumC family protein [Merismopedia glauca]|uniref:Lipopolysaccharide biosynthesis protein n=1 Tax=Merismopedia glauca CCAP 1448/3 TaxID=1296344 RepID=A0A2T1C1D4_9CYAN|nr:polysaccharide biosynthesis tyrosine autokinase [Merismopedia glauca]PSB02086.1 lipopolysaccharide biosynthesis protein [Merismopedia glauca CCAP 1448/3]